MRKGCKSVLLITLFLMSLSHHELLSFRHSTRKLFRCVRLFRSGFSSTIKRKYRVCLCVDYRVSPFLKPPNSMARKSEFDLGGSAAPLPLPNSASPCTPRVSFFVASAAAPAPAPVAPVL